MTEVSFASLNFSCLSAEQWQAISVLKSFEHFFVLSDKEVSSLFLVINCHLIFTFALHECIYYLEYAFVRFASSDR